MKDKNPEFLPAIFGMYRIRNIEVKNRTELDSEQMKVFMKDHEYCDSCENKTCEDRIDCSKFPDLDNQDPWDMGPDED